ncbi:energy-coupling factor transport system ATP-binding protein [Salsuginibacillus halophilus]|uniref:Energy-coupling factor transport system ATP-binding protein n=1 Tax=Salsuginibacillus halophilus TaxID=517424 RepID=A0A2P8HKW7_9BACI|nr:ATP-binding cassette domain-containing protein [Salsuginibacillus halophilus]PSL46861.1 energy-coupling factor transport system ATP-binding protein [Salsuginibacillus halophilus]
MLNVQQVSFQYPGGMTAIRDVTFSIQPGEFTAIVGGNGSGKSTITKLLSGLLQPDAGSVQLFGNPVKAGKSGVGLVFQNPEDQMVASTVEDEILFSLENQRTAPADMPAIVEDVLQAVRLEGFEMKEPFELSGGQKQRAAIASVLAMKPDLFIFDEATSMLDPTGREEVQALMHQLHHQGTTVLNVTHDMEEALHAERLLAFQHGELAYDGAPAPLLHNTAFLQELELVPPFHVRMLEALKAEEVPLQETYFSEERLVDALCHLRPRT